MIEIRLTQALYQGMKSDLARPHPFAAERVGFAVGRLVSATEDSRLLALSEYMPVPDRDYIDDPLVGARIGREALTAASHRIYYGRPRGEGVFHVHVHGDRGETGMSGTDARELPPLIPGFRSVGPNGPHGILIFSADHFAGWVWLPGEDELRIDKCSLIGAPVAVLRRGVRC
jgi:hypothetical protein